MPVLQSGRIASRLVVATLGAALLAAACGDEPIVPDDTPPDLTGSYTIVSFWSALSPEGDTLTPPAVSGSFVLRQTQVVGQEASGTLDTLDIAFPGGSLGGKGVYRNRFDGSWEQEFSEGLQFVGNYTLEGRILTVAVTEPPLGVSTTVWRRE